MKTTIWIVACLIALTSPQKVQSAPSEEPLTLARTVSETLRNNGELQALREELGIAEAEAARAGLHSDLVFEAGMESGALTGSENEERYSAEISREFLAFGKGERQRKVAGKELEAAQAQVKDAERLLTLEAKEHFYNYLLAREQVELARRTAELDRDLVRIAEERFAAGDLAEVEVDLSRVEVSRTQERVVTLERDAVLLLTALAQLMGRPQGEMPQILERLDFKEFATEPAELIQRALHERPDLRALLLQLEGRNAAIDLARVEARPNITGGISYSYERSAEEVAGVEERTADHLLGLRISVPLPSATRRDALLREMTARRGGVERRLAALHASVVREVETASTGLEATGRSLRLYREEILPMMESNLQTVREAYRLGESGTLNIIEEQRRYYLVQSDYLKVLRDWNHALATLEAAVAAELTESEGEIP